MWKLTDFGFTAQAMSSALLTSQSKGTPGFRAPELLKEDEAHFTNKVDIWALGCVLYELASGKRRYKNDWAVFQLPTSPDLIISLPFESQFWKHHFSEIIHDLLDRDWKTRPRASNVCRLFSSYLRILDPTIYQLMSFSPWYSSYSEWKNLITTSSSELEYLTKLAEAYERQEEHQETAVALFHNAVGEHLLGGKVYELYDLTQSYIGNIALDLWQKLAKSLITKCQYKDAAAIYNSAIAQNPTKLSLQKALADIFVLSGDFDEGIKLYEKVISSQRTNFWFWKGLCEACIAKGDKIGVITMIEQGMMKYPTHLSLALLLSNLYALTDTYERAIETQMMVLEKDPKNLVNHLRSSLTEFSAELDSNENEATDMLGR